MAQYALRKGVAIVTLRNPPVNGLSLAVRDGILKSLDQADKDKADAVVLLGAGRTFPAGADISEFAKGTYASPPDLNQVVHYMDSYTRPLVACIHGTALGGGLETALGCHWRIGASSCKIGLPEVHLGILPGAGGTQRLPRLTGFSKAVEMIVSGRMVGSVEAARLGILDSVFDLPKGFSSEYLENVGIDFALSAAVQDTPLVDRVLSARAVPAADGDAEELFQQTLQQVTKSSKGYLAPINIVKAVRAASMSPSFESGMEAERALFEELMQGPQAKALQYFFFAERNCSKIPDIPADTAPAPVKRTGVIGGGTMGTGIAMNFLNAGMPVTLMETSEALCESATARVKSTYEMSSAFKKGKLTKEDLDKKMSLFSTTVKVAGLADADLVIEAAFENMPLKKKIFQSLSEVCKPEAILASNTSNLSIDELASSTNNPTNVVGLHFFSPANVMKLLEVVRGKDSSPTSIATALDVGKRIGKVSVLSGNCYGFIGNRLLHRYAEEAVYMVEEGASPAKIDSVLKKELGLAMGIFEMFDLAGIDIGWRQRTELGLTDPKSRDPSKRYSSLMDKLCEQGFFGQKTARGWYKYDPATPRVPKPSKETEEIIASHRKEEGFSGQLRDIPDAEIIERCMFPLVNEGVKVLEEGIAIRPADVDVVYVYGYGFPRYRGGPMWWAEREVGLPYLLHAMKRYQKLFPNVDHWKPSPLLEAAVASGAPLKEELYFAPKK